VLPGYMLPNRILTSAELPKNANGKVDRVRLRDS
jgi:acyl-coenzyme A synthetase/AMP-(fatty) acid ligase